MKWSNKGKELELKAKVLVEQFKSRTGVYLFGAGMLGEEARCVLGHFAIFRGYIDNSVKKQMEGFNGSNVLALKDFLNKDESSWIVVTASETNEKDICYQLESAGLCEGKDFFRFRQFMDDVFPLISFYYYNELFVELAQICLTERCTLKCKKCAHGCFNVSSLKTDLSVEFMKESADVFFSKFDFVKEFVLIGGEPFLYKDIKTVISYIGERYRHQMGMFAITTNGTILPDEEIVSLCTKYDMTLRVSDYSDTLPHLKKKYDSLYQRFSKNKVIVWKTIGEDSWFDYGFGEIDRGNEEERLIHVFEQCKTSCREIRGSKYYYCVMARSVSENLEMNVGKDDFIDLNEINDRNLLLEFQMGFSDKGYLDMCRFCRGAEAKNYLIPAAEQLGGKKK